MVEVNLSVNRNIPVNNNVNINQNNVENTPKLYEHGTYTIDPNVTLNKLKTLDERAAIEGKHEGIIVDKHGEIKLENGEKYNVTDYVVQGDNKDEVYRYDKNGNLKKVSNSETYAYLEALEKHNKAVNKGDISNLTYLQNEGSKNSILPALIEDNSWNIKERIKSEEKQQNREQYLKDVQKRRDAYEEYRQYKEAEKKFYRDLNNYNNTPKYIIYYKFLNDPEGTARAIIGTKEEINAEIEKIKSWNMPFTIVNKDGSIPKSEEKPQNPQQVTEFPNPVAGIQQAVAALGGFIGNAFTPKPETKQVITKPAEYAELNENQYGDFQSKLNRAYNDNGNANRASNEAELQQFLNSNVQKLGEGTNLYATSGYVNIDGSMEDFKALGNPDTYLIQAVDNDAVNNLVNPHVIKLTVLSTNPNYDEISKVLNQNNAAVQNQIMDYYEYAQRQNNNMFNSSNTPEKLQQYWDSPEFKGIYNINGKTFLKSDMMDAVEIKDAEGNRLSNPILGLDQYNTMKDGYYFEQEGDKFVLKKGDMFAVENEFLKGEKDRIKDPYFYKKVYDYNVDTTFKIVDTALWALPVGGWALKGSLNMAKLALASIPKQTFPQLLKNTAIKTAETIIKNPAKSALTAVNIGATGYTAVDDSLTTDQKVLTAVTSLGTGALFGGITKGLSRVNSYNNIAGKFSRTITNPIVKPVNEIRQRIVNKAKDSAFKTAAEIDSKLLGEKVTPKEISNMYNEYVNLKKKNKVKDSELYKLLGKNQSFKMFKELGTKDLTDSKILSYLYADYSNLKKQNKGFENKSILTKIVGKENSENFYNYVNKRVNIGDKVGKVTQPIAEVLTTPLALPLTGMGIGYGIDILGRVTSSDNPFGTAVNIYSTEVLPMMYGGKLGFGILDKAFTKYETNDLVKKTLRNINKEKSSGLAEALGFKNKSLYEIDTRNEFNKMESIQDRKDIREDVRDYLIKENIDPDELVKFKELQRLSNPRSITYEDIKNNITDKEMLDKINKLEDKALHDKDYYVRQKASEEYAALMKKLEDELAKKSSIELTDYRNKLIKDLREIKGIDVLDSKELSYFVGKKLKTNKKAQQAYLKARTAEEGQGIFSEKNPNGVYKIPLFEPNKINPVFLKEGFRKGVSVHNPYNIDNPNQVNLPIRTVDTLRNKYSSLDYDYAGTHITDAGHFLDTKRFTVTKGTSEIWGLYGEGAPFVGRYAHMYNYFPDLKFSILSKFSTDKAPTGAIFGIKDFTISPVAEITQNRSYAFKKLFGEQSTKSGKEQNDIANEILLAESKQKNPSESPLLPQMKKEAEAVIPYDTEITMIKTPVSFVQLEGVRLPIKAGVISNQKHRKLNEIIKETLISEIKRASDSLKSLKSKSSELSEKILQKIPNLTEGEYRNLYNYTKNYIESIKDIRVYKPKVTSQNVKPELKYEIITKKDNIISKKSQSNNKKSSDSYNYNNYDGNYLSVGNLFGSGLISEGIKPLQKDTYNIFTDKNYSLSPENTYKIKSDINTYETPKQTTSKSKSYSQKPNQYSKENYYAQKTPVLPYNPFYDSKPYEPSYSGKPYEPSYSGKPYEPSYSGKPYEPSYSGKPYEPSYSGKPYEPPYSPTPYNPPYSPPPYSPPYSPPPYSPPYSPPPYSPPYSPPPEEPPYEPPYPPKRPKKKEDDEEKEILKMFRSGEKFALMTHTVRNPLSLLGDNSYIDVEQYKKAQRGRIRVNGKMTQNFGKMPQLEGTIFGIPVKETTRSKRKTKSLSKTKGKAKPSKKTKNSKRR